MIGYLIYEFFELVYYLSKLGYNGVAGLYYWYYSNNNITREDLENKISSLKLKIKKFEEIKSKI
tara:strand:- start:2979 stop:3170 length:192 start_codon:yes stop_codon:yes gene_type:complete